jgi:hypothetical protein
MGYRSPAPVNPGLRKTPVYRGRMASPLTLHRWHGRCREKPARSGIATNFAKFMRYGPCFVERYREF